MSQVRDYFPGNNTPEGFFSYYKYILDQEEANKIYCIKGGPGTGKSTFMKKIGNYAVKLNEDVDFLHCSSDENSLDGIILKKRKIAFVDGTSPHIIDPITPGAVDKIIDLGNYWDVPRIEEKKDMIIRYNNEASNWYKHVFNYLGAARKIYDSINFIVSKGIEESDIDKVVDVIIKKEMGTLDMAFKYGNIKKFFASGITPTGNIHYLKSLVKHTDKIYFINVPEGYENTSFMNAIVKNAITKGLDIEVFYCPINPRKKIEHIVIPALSLAFITGNKWHDLEPWEIFTSEEEDHQITMIDINDYANIYSMERNSELIANLSSEYEKLIKTAILALAKVKENRDIVEQIYIKNMDFQSIDKITMEYIKQLK